MCTGERLRRLEDPILIRGEGTLVDDIKPPDMIHAKFVRRALHGHGS